MESVLELDKTLHEVLDLVVTETMARDLMNEMYRARVVRMDLNQMLLPTHGYDAKAGQLKFVSHPSPLPILSSDPGLFKCIHGNAIRNALKYGKRGGAVTTEVSYNAETEEFEMTVTNLPGPGHEKLVKLGDKANDLVFAKGTRLHTDTDSIVGKVSRQFSAGDGTWITRKCATILKGAVNIKFEEERTVFTFRARVKPGEVAPDDSFQVPSDVWGIGIDDSKIQRKLLQRILLHLGVEEDRQIILGADNDEISGFVDLVVKFTRDHPDNRLLLLVDENLELDGPSEHNIVSGSECVRQIRSALNPPEEKRLLAVVRSANDSPTDVAVYHARAHAYLAKVPLRAAGVRESFAPLWEARFASLDDSERSGFVSRVASIEDIKDLLLISPMELMVELETIDALCVGGDGDATWPKLWERLHQLKGDLMSVSVSGLKSPASTINMIEALRGAKRPVDFTNKWVEIRSSVIALIINNED